MRELLDLVFPRACPSCQRPGVHVCDACLTGLTPGERAAVRGMPHLRYATEYSGWVRDCLIAYKNGAADQVHVLAAVLRTVVPTDVLVIPMPTTEAKVTQRGFDTVAELAAASGARWAPGLRLTRQVSDQVGLDAGARRANVSGAMCATGLVSGHIVLLDDVVTTGATVAEAARALRVAGAATIRAVALCAARG